MQPGDPGTGRAEAMKKEVAQKLARAAKETEVNLSNPLRPGNKLGENFELHDIQVLSEDSAAAIYKKDSGKKVALFFYWRESWNRDEGKWFHFPPTDSHILGMATFGEVKARIERENYHHNFADEEVLN